jgi:hypothetical protein
MPEMRDERDDRQHEDDAQNQQLDRHPAEPAGKQKQVSSGNQRGHPFRGALLPYRIGQMTTEQLVTIFLTFCVVVWLWRQVWRVVRRYRPRIRLGDWMTGTVYIFWDRSMPNESRIVKVGVTQRRDINKRLTEVRDTMGGDPVCIWKMDHVPYPYAVEFSAHQFLDRYRVLWLKGSTRGTEWFYAVGDKGMARVIGAVEKAARRVRKIAKAKKRWSDKADMWISVWKLTEWGVSRSYPFRQVSVRVEREPSRGGSVPNKNKQVRGSKPTPPTSRTSQRVSRASQPSSRPRGV